MAAPTNPTVDGGDPTVVINNSGPDVDGLQDVLEHLPEVIKESKAGYKTTEFWLTIATSLLVVVDGIPMPDRYEGFVATALVVAYALSRGLAKKGIPSVEPVKEDTPAA